MILKDIPYINQSDIAPTGCESVTAVMLLQYLGVSETVDHFMGEVLKKQPYENRNGEMWGPDPRDAFVGDPTNKDALGCYAPVIIQALEKVLPKQYLVQDETGKPLKELCKQYIDKKMPVIVWNTIDRKPSYLGVRYRLLDSGEYYDWKSNEHCALLIGYDSQNYYLQDPWNNLGIVPIETSLLEKRYEEMGSQAIGIRKKEKQ